MKKKLLRIFLFIMTLLSCIVPSEKNHIHKANAITTTGGRVYFDNSVCNWTIKNLYLVYKQSSWAGLFKMNQISNTNVYYVSASNWGGVEKIAFINTQDAWGNGNFDPVNNNPTNSTNYNSSYNLDNSSSVYYARPTETTATKVNMNMVYLGGAYSSLNHSMKVTINDASAGTVQISGYKYKAYDSTEASSGSNNVNIGRGTTVNYTASTNAGYEFKGWYSDSSYKTLLSSSTTYSFNVGDSASHLYAKWNAKSYTITLNNQGATTSGQKTKSATYKSTISNLTNGVPTKIGYDFGGYFTETNGKGTKYFNADGSSTGLTYTKTSGMTVYAYWIPKNYTINFISNNNLSNPDSISVTLDSEFGTLPIPTPPSEEYVFLGWYLDQEADDNEKITNTTILNTTDFNITNDDITEITLYARYKELQKYTISFNSNGGNTINPIQVFETLNYGFIAPLPVPVKDGYSFSGWKYGDILVTNESKLAVEGNHELIASWTANPYNVTLSQENSTTNATITSITATFDSAMPTINSFPTRTGYTFEGYYSQSGGTGTKYYNADGTSARTWNLPSNSTLYPKWTAIKYSVEYNANGGTGTIANSECTYDQTFNLPNNTFTKVGYNFAGWNTKADGTGTSYVNGASVKNLTSVNNGTATLYAQWTPITYTIILDSNNESGDTTTVTATYDSPTTLPLDSFSQPGYEIVGWSTTYNGDKLCTDTLAANQNLTSTQGAEVTLYAIWDIKTYDITYSYADDLNDVTHNNPKGYTILSDSITLTEPTRENYTFAGWTCTYLGVTEPTKNLVIPKGTYGDLTITANWDQKVTVYIDMSHIYDQYNGQYWIESPFVYYYNSTTDENSGTFGDQLMTKALNDSNIFKYDIYLTKNNESIIESFDYIKFGYTKLNMDDAKSFHDRPQSSNTYFPISGNNNGSEYLFKLEGNKIVHQWESGKTYHISEINWSYEYDDGSRKWFTFKIEEVDGEGTDGKITFITDLNWGGITDFYINGSKGTSSNNKYTVTVNSVTDIDYLNIYFKQNGVHWHSQDTYKSWHQDPQIRPIEFSSLYIIEAPRVNYYDGETLVHSSSYIESNQVHFIEKEGYKLEGWYTTPTFDEGTKFEKGYDIVGSINIYANYVVAHDYFIYVEAKNIGWDMENMSVYKWSDYFSNHNNSWPGSKDDIVYLGNGIYRVHIDASKSFDYLIFCDTNTKNANKVATDIVQTQDIVMTPTMSYYVISSNTVLGSSGESKGKYLNKISYEKSLENDIYAQKNSSNSNINEFRFTAGLEDYDDLVEIPQDTVGKEFGYKFIFINGDECYVGYWNFTTNTMLDCVRYEGTLYEASNEGYKGYYSLTLTDDINFKYSNYNQIIVVACYRDNTGNTQIIKAQEYNIVGTGTNVQLYKIER